MKKLKIFTLLMIFMIVLAGCSGSKSESKSGTITIEPYELSEDETLLISKTGVDTIDYFSLSGKLGTDLDLKFSVEIYKKGVFKGELLTTGGEPEAKFKEELVSFAVSRVMGKDSNYLKIMAGAPSSLASVNYADSMSAHSYGMLIDEEITLEKNKPVYLAQWLGTNKSKVGKLVSNLGELPEGIEDYEIVLLYRVVLTER